MRRKPDAIERAMHRLAGSTLEMAPRDRGIGPLLLRAELARATDREARLRTVTSVSGLSLFGLALGALLLRLVVSPEPSAMLMVALPVVGVSVFSGLALAADFRSG